MECEKCGNETGAIWKTLCLSCWKKMKQEQTDKNYLESEKSKDNGVDYE